MDELSIKAKFGDVLAATERTFRLGIDVRITRAIAARFAGRTVLETCTGGGFTTISLAETADHVFTIELNPMHQAQAMANVKRKCLEEKVTFVLGNCMAPESLAQCHGVDAVFMDPDWAQTGPLHRYRFVNSNMQPPADELARAMLARVPNGALILPVEIPESEFSQLPEYELTWIFLSGARVLQCLFFGSIRSGEKTSEIRV